MLIRGIRYDIQCEDRERRVQHEYVEIERLGGEAFGGGVEGTEHQPGDWHPEREQGRREQRQPHRLHERRHRAPSVARAVASCEDCSGVAERRVEEGHVRHGQH